MIGTAGRLVGHFYVHNGDDSALVYERASWWGLQPLLRDVTKRFEKPRSLKCQLAAQKKS